MNSFNPENITCAYSPFCGEGDSREDQIKRALEWVLNQKGNGLTIISPKRQADPEIVNEILRAKGVQQLV